MPLHDHSRPPISSRHDWPQVHNRWAVSLADALNRTLPRRFLAETDVHLGRQGEADVVEFDLDSGPGDNGVPHPGGDGGGGTAVAVAAPTVYTPPAPAMSIPVLFHDAIEVSVFDLDRARRRVAGIEIVSPANKDRPDERTVFARKCLGYLKAGVGLVMIDIVTNMHFNLHNELVLRGQSGEGFLMPGGSPTYAVAYRPVYRGKRNLLDVWPHALRVGAGLPAVPLALLGYGCVPLDLEGTYTEACTASRIP